MSYGVIPQLRASLQNAAGGCRVNLFSSSSRAREALKGIGLRGAMGCSLTGGVAQNWHGMLSGFTVPHFEVRIARKIRTKIVSEKPALALHVERAGFEGSLEGARLSKSR